MQDIIMQEFKKELEKTETNLRRIASENILNRQEHTIEHSHTMRDIELITRISRLLKNSEHEQHKAELLLKGENFLPLNSNFKNRHPIAVYIDDQPHPAKYLRDVARVVCAHLLHIKYDAVVAESENFRTIARGDCFASFKKHEVACENPDEIQVGHGDTLFIDSCRMVVNQMGLLRRMMALVGVPETSVVVEVSDTYLRKRREVKMPQRKSLILDIKPSAD